MKRSHIKQQTFKKNCNSSELIKKYMLNSRTTENFAFSSEDKKKILAYFIGL